MPGAIRSILAVALAVVLAALGSGCALQPPAPWERELHARPAMSMTADPLEQRFLSHIYASKENSSGGDGIGGGGCGCN